MEEHYIKDVGKITYVYGVNLEEHKTVIEKQQKRIAELEKQLDQLKQQLEESFTEEDVEGLIEDRNKTIKFLQKELAEKDKEIERLKNLFELNNEVVINQGKEIFDLRVQVLQQKQNQTQFAIQELEKVKAWCEENLDDLDDAETDERVCLAIGLDRSIITGDMWLYDYIDQQIKELKGEKDVED